MMSVSKLLDSIVVHLHVILVLCLVLLAVSNNFNGDNGDAGKLLLDGRRSSSSSSSLFVMCFSNSPPLTTSRRSTSASSLLSSRNSANRHHATLKGASSSLSSNSNSHHYLTDYSTTSLSSSTALRSATSNSSADINAATSTSSTTTSKAKSSSTKKKTAKKVKRSPKKKQQYSQKKGVSSNNSMAAARMYNSQLTKCNSVSELLTSFMEQTSPSGGGSSGGGSSATQSSPSMMSSATHMAGATKVNSVNFSTCLHRLARFAAKGSYNSTPSQQQQSSSNNSNSNNSNNNRSNDARKQVLSDPRFALLVCSMAEMASGCDARISVKDGKELLYQWKSQLGSSNDSNGNDELLGMGGMKEADDVFNDIVGLTSTTSNNNKHGVPSAMTTRDRYNTAEEIMDQLSTPQTKNSFSSRECSNVCWALAKLRVAPPHSAFALGRVHDDDDDDDDEITSGGGRGNKNDFLSSRQFVSLDEMALDVISSTLQVRMQLFDEARKRKSGSSSNGAWIPELSRLAGKVMDLIAVKIILDYGSRNDGGDGGGKEKFNPQEMASVLWAYAKSQRADDALFSIVAAELIRQTEYELGRGGQGPRPQELSNTIWAFATAGIRGEQQIELVKFAADALDEGEGLFFGNSFKPQELANTGWALATLHSKRSEGTSTEIEDEGVVRILRWVAKDIKQRVDAYKPQEISNSVWAFSTVGFGYDESCGTNAHNDYVHVATDDPIGDKELVYETLEVVAENAISRLHNFKAQELNNLAWGFTRLGHRTERTEKLLVGVAEELTARTWQFKPQDVGTTLWSLATAECFDKDAFMAGASRLNFKHIRSFKPQEMSNTVWALATAGFAPKHIRAFDTTLVPASQLPTNKMIMSDPITECFAAVASEAMRRPQDFKDQELKDVLWAFSKIGVRHPALFKKVAQHLVGQNGRGFSGFSSQGLGNTLWSFAKQAQLSLEVIDSLGDSVKLGSTGRLAVYETSCLDIGEKTIKTLFVRAAEGGVELGLDRFTNQDLSNTVWAYSTLGLLHSGFFKEAEMQVMKRLKNLRPFKGQEIANILWSFATLNAQPDHSLIDALSSYIASVCSGKNKVADEYSISRVFKRQELANVAWSCAVIGRYPKELMNILYTGIVGTNNDPNQMKQIFNDDGLQQSSIMTLYYVQLAADIEASKLKLALPMGFPNGWGESEGHHGRGNGDDLIQMSSSMLTLTISKLQRDVSNTFTEIGFENILEHVIDTNEIKHEYGVQLPQTPQEFLSIDIANIDQQVGVEVDGPGHFVRLIDDTSRRSNKVTADGQFADRGENRVNGPTLLKHRLLTHLGWNIIHLPYWEYQSLGGDRESERKYCESLLR